MASPYECSECGNTHPRGCHGHTKVRDAAGAVIRTRECRLSPIAGGTVCHKHGGAAPQVRHSASQRLLSLVDPALDELHRILTSRSAPDNVKVAAANTVLDRVRDTAKVAKQELSGPDGAPIEVDNLNELRNAALARALRDPKRARRIDRVARELAEREETG